MSRRAFLTGGTGFVGGALLRRLLDDGWELRALARTPAKLEALRHQRLAVVPGDITRAAGLADAMRGCDAVFHLAAWYEIGVADRDRMDRVNALGTRTMLAAAREAGAGRFVHCSTIGAYGATRGGPQDEGWYDPVSVSGLHYTRSKRAAHEAVQAAARDGMDAVIVSPASIFGPGDHSIIATLLRFIVRGWLKVGFYRRTKMGFVHVDDVARGLLLGFERGAPGRDYILVDRTLSLDEILGAAARLAGRRPPWFWLPDWMIRWSWPLSPVVAPVLRQGPWVLKEAVAMMDGVSMDFDGRRARDELGWTPGDFDARMRETVDWFRAQA